MEVDGINLAIGGGAVTAIAGIAGAWIRARYGRTRVEPTPLPVEKLDKFVTRGEFNRHVEENERDHGNLFKRLATTEQETAEQRGTLAAILSTVRDIQQILMKGARR